MNPEPKNKKISIIICTGNRALLLKRSLLSLLNQTLEASEIIIIDQSPDDSTHEVIKAIGSPLVKYIKDSGTGLSRARNIGWRNAEGEIVAFTDDDSYVDEKWVEAIAATFDSIEKIGVMGGKIIPIYEERNIHWSVPAQYEYILPSYSQETGVSEYADGNLPIGVCFVTTRSILQAHNGFNEHFGVNSSQKIQICGEEGLVAMKVKKQGLKLIYNPNLVTYHPVPLSRQTQRFFNKRMFSEGCSHALMWAAAGTITNDAASLTNKMYLLFMAILKALVRRKCSLGDFFKFLGREYVMFCLLFNRRINSIRAREMVESKTDNY